AFRNSTVGMIVPHSRFLYMQKNRRLQLAVWQEIASFKLLEDAHKCRSALSGVGANKRANALQRPECARFDFVGIDDGPIIAAHAVHFHELPTSLCTRRDFEM